MAMAHFWQTAPLLHGRSFYPERRPTLKPILPPTIFPVVERFPKKMTSCRSGRLPITDVGKCRGTSEGARSVPAELLKRLGFTPEILNSVSRAFTHGLPRSVPDFRSSVPNL